jgi:hypothetical protein
VNAQTTGYWNLEGNNGTNSSNFIGTIGNQPLIFKTLNTERMRLLPNKPFLGIGVLDPQATLHLHFKDPNEPLSQKLLQLTTDATGNTDGKGFSIFSDAITKDLKFKHHEQSKFSIEGPGGGIVINSEGDIGIGIVPPPRQELYRAPNLHTNGIIFAGVLEANSARITNSITAKTLSTQSATIFDTLTADEVIFNTANIVGTLTADDLKVTGLLCAKEVRVKLSGAPCWPDYVFSNNYNLMPLNELEQFVTENHHLPNVPSTAEVEANGVNVGEMNAILLQKVEELTLYIIDLQKQINELKK